MNPITDILFTVIWFGLLVWAIRSMARGWNMILQPRSNDLKMNIKTRQVTKVPHPEMADVEQGDELLVVNFKREKNTDPRFKLDSPELHNLGDPLYKSLQDRIDELDEDDDDDDGGIISRA